MKKFVTGFVLLMIAGGIASCRKTSFIDSPDALLNTSSDTLHFDTVFTSTGSVTQAFKVFNLNNQKLRLADVKLMGGSASAFKMNVDGSAGASFSNVEIEPNDSMYVFVRVTVNPTAANLPFIVQDSILIRYNGNERFVQLQAFGQNANFLRNRRVTKDSAWNNDKPFVILGGLTVDENVTLTINKGCKIYCHADAPILVNGTLRVNGEKYDSTRVVFSGDRLDIGYRDYPGGWPGIYFNSSSKNNVINYAIIKNAYQGVISLLPASNNTAKVTLNQCIIDNVYDAGILSLNSSITATNCLISNCGSNIAIAAGGSYSFNYCTVVSYANAYLNHKNPVLIISNTGDQDQTFPLSAVFRNCIFYGEGGSVDDEIAVNRKGNTAFSLSFENILYKNKNDLQPAPVNSIKNQQPGFDSTDAGKRYFNFRLKDGSPAINKAARLATVATDLDGNPRGLNPDIGCYERQ